jgi:lipoate-protein ligase A
MGIVNRATWRLLLTEPQTGAENMALDEALMARARRSGENVLRVYSWSEPTLSLGRHQRARDVYLPALAREHGVAIVRRMTGGRALLHHREVTYSVTAPATGDGSLHRSYSAINEMLVAGLARLGVRVSPALPVARMPVPASAPCFEQPATGELVVNGRKLVGSAQVREDGALLQHGSILIEDDQTLIGCLAAYPVGAVAPAATLHDAMGRIPAVPEVASALFDAVRELHGTDATPLALDEQTLEQRARALARYRSDDWTWRR